MNLSPVHTTVPGAGQQDAGRSRPSEPRRLPEPSTALDWLRSQRDHAFFLRMQEVNLLTLALYRLRGASDEETERSFEAMLDDLPDQTRRAEVKAQWKTTLQRIENKHRIDLCLKEPLDEVIGKRAELDRRFGAMLTTVKAPLAAHLHGEWQAFMAALAGQMMPYEVAIPKLNELANLALIDHCLVDVDAVTRVSLDALFPSRLPAHAEAQDTGSQAGAAPAPEDIGPDDWTSTRLTCNPVFPRCGGARDRLAGALWRAPIPQLMANLLGVVQDPPARARLEAAFHYACLKLADPMETYGVAFVRIAQLGQAVLTTLQALGAPAPAALPVGTRRGGRAGGNTAQRARRHARTQATALDRIASHGNTLVGALAQLLVEVGACEALAAKAYRPGMPAEYRAPLLPARYDELLKQAVDETMVQFWAQPDPSASDDRVLAIVQESTTFLVLAVEQKHAQERAYMQALSERRRQRNAR